MPDRVAPENRIVIGRVGVRLKPCLTDVGHEVRPPFLEERTPDAPLAGGLVRCPPWNGQRRQLAHSARAEGARPSPEMQEDGLGLVLGVVGERDDFCAVPACRQGQPAKPFAPQRLLWADTRMEVARRPREDVRRKRQPELVRQHLRGCPVRARLRARHMVDMAEDRHHARPRRNSGKADGEGTGSCHRRIWRFTSGNVRYIVGEPGCTDRDVPVGAKARLEVDIDGKPAARMSAPPSGLSRDGASAVYRRLPVAAGEREFAVRMRDNARSAGFDYTLERRVTLKPAQVLVIDFDPHRGTLTLQ